MKRNSMNTLPKQDGVAVQVYDIVKEKVYYKIVGGAIFSRQEVVRRDRISNQITLFVSTQSQVDEVVINGIVYKPENKEYSFTPNLTNENNGK